MSEIRYILDGNECNPLNRKDIQYEFNFAEEIDKRRLELSVTSLVFVREDYTRIQQWRNTFGDYYGMPLEIQYTDGTIIKYLLDFSDNLLIEEGRRIEVSIKRYKGWDMFFKNADALAFQNPQIGWTSGDFVEVDYLVIPDDQKSLFLSLTISIFALSKELAIAIDKLSQNTEALIKASVPVGVPPAPDWGAIIVASIRLAANIAYTIAIILALINLGAQLIEVIFPKLRQFKGIRYKRLIEKCVNFLGYELESSLLDSLAGLTILPQPSRGEANIFTEFFRPNTLAYTNGYPTAQDTIPTLGQAINEIEKLFYAETRVVGNVVKIETRPTYEQNANQNLKRAFNNQSQISNENSINSGEIFKRLVAVYQTDPTDINTYDDTEGTVSEVSSEVLVSNDPNLELIKNYAELRINFSRGTRKDSLTWLEEAAKSFAQAIDVFTSGSLSSKVEARKGALQLSSQYFSNTKLLYCSGTKLSPNQNQFIGTEAILQYHEDSFIENNQKKVFSNMPIAMTEGEMFTLLENNFVSLDSGKTIEVTRVAWSEEEALATLDYTLRKQNVNEQTISL